MKISIVSLEESTILPHRRVSTGWAERAMIDVCLGASLPRWPFPRFLQGGTPNFAIAPSTHIGHVSVERRSRPTKLYLCSGPLLRGELNCGTCGRLVNSPIGLCRVRQRSALLRSWVRLKSFYRLQSLRPSPPSSTWQK